ncbi:Type IV secretory pathway, VirD4 components [Olavius algarvensis associated proteobacterium Delta 3]|nr:Type IV secretory pathway, VirD4 components [Olavius algarvensis associated proteobacterium Delta 3]
MADQPLEALLRPPVEGSAIVANIAGAIIAGAAPQVLLMPGGVGIAISAVFLTRAAFLFHRARGLIRYQRRLFVLPFYRINRRWLHRRANAKELYLGEGFEWKPRHSQRRADIDKPMYAHHADPGPGWKRARAVIGAVAGKGGPIGRLLMAFFNSQNMFNPWPPRPYVEGDPKLHGVGLYEPEEHVSIKQGERVAHTFVVGTTRVGKTRLLEVIVAQDIRNGSAVIVFDPKGDADLLASLQWEAKKSGRSDDFKVFHLGFPDFSVCYNPVGAYSRVTEVATRIAGQLPGQGSSAAFREFCWRFINVVAKALDALGVRMSYEAVLEGGADIDALTKRYLEHVFKKHGLDPAKVISEMKAEIEASGVKPDMRGRDEAVFLYCEYFKKTDALVDKTAASLIKTSEHDKSHFDKLVASLFPLLEKLTTGKAALLLSPSADRDIRSEHAVEDMSWYDVIKSNSIVYVGLDALSDADVARAVGNSMFADLTAVAGTIYKEPDESASAGQKSRKICVHADEFNELVGKEFVPLANKAAGAGFQLTAYTQTLSDIVARFDSQAVAGQVIGNLGTLIMMRVKERATAELLTSRLKDCEITHLMMESGTTDSSNPESDVHFTSSARQRITTQRVPILHPGDLDALPKGQAFVLSAGTLYKVRLPMFEKEPDMAGNIEQMTEEMRKQYDVGNSAGALQASALS